jgi:hypothetical protein
MGFEKWDSKKLLDREFRGGISRLLEMLVETAIMGVGWALGAEMLYDHPIHFIRVRSAEEPTAPSLA